MKRILFILTFLFFLGGCAVTQTPTPATPPPANTEVVPASSIPSQTSEATINTEVAKKAEIDRNITQFLSAEGEFSDEVLKDKHFIATKIGREVVEDDLGIVSGGENDFDSKFMEGILLGSYANKEGDLIVIFGTKDFEGNRLVLPMYVDGLAFKYDIERVPIQYFNSRNLAWTEENFNPSGLYTPAEEVVKVLDDRIGEVMLNELILGFPTDPGVIKDRILAHGGTEEEFEMIWNMWSKNVEVSKNLFYFLSKSHESWKQYDKDTGSSLFTIDSINDLENINDRDGMVLVGNLVFIKQ
jgi:hypothetical protein